MLCIHIHIHIHIHRYTCTKTDAYTCIYTYALIGI